LAHASTPSVRSIIVLTNDRKNDWHMGGAAAFNVEQDLRAIRRGWAPIPLVHPMLAFEAASRANIDSVILLDCAYLAAIFRKTGVPSGRFVDAALSIELPDPKREDKLVRKEKARV